MAIKRKKEEEEEEEEEEGACRMAQAVRVSA
jgi:hypothetical protein